LDKLPLEDRRLVEDLHDSEFTAVIERSPGDARMIDCLVIAGLGGLLKQTVDEKHLATWFQGSLHGRPERVEICGWDMGQPEAEEDGVKCPDRRNPLEQVCDDVVDAIGLDPLPVDGDHFG
jgi:hypothetical protein